MTRVCLVGSPDVVLKYELLSRETSREALSTYDLSEPFENTVALDTVSVGAAVSLLNDLNWYLVRFVDTVLVREPSISEDEWLSRDLAEAVRSNRISPEETGTYLKLYGVETADGTEADETASDGGAVQTERKPQLVEPLYVRRTDGDHPEYDLRDVEETVVVRVSESEFEL
ncbi:DUF5804 family protein [Natranaeroarchaeum sulfidigenes]|uniref:Uncharacterized protein n=1 Tax=Natranaeroarchaeum sulfidigenes TaxID=2784880 RepID=A0A897MP35_9EURY|nr:DUF5804 family protein [Natranaeroarchaeum sulfidigenes]QSG02101.1 Uncharacterized protein AArcS_0878 [Natranaeroarchaeum sulfidigenes]